MVAARQVHHPGLPEDQRRARVLLRRVGINSHLPVDGHLHEHHSQFASLRGISIGQSLFISTTS